MNILLIDIGNSTIDCRIYNQTLNITPIFKYITNSKESKNINNIANELKKYNINKIIVSCVVDEYINIFNKIAVLLKCDIKYITHNDIDYNLLKIDEPSTLGADFICNFNGALSLNIKNVIIVSLGTASTISIIKKQNFIGAIISSGLEINTATLFKNVYDLNSFKLEYSNEIIGKNTNQAINIGIMNGHYEMIYGLIKKIQKKYHIKNVIFTGGNCFKIIKLIKLNKINFIEDLIFKGMIKYC